MTENTPEIQNETETSTAAAVVEAPEQTTVQDNQTNETSADDGSSESEKTVPLSVLQKERKKKKQIQQELEQYKARETTKTEPQEEDYSKYESATKEDLSKSQFLTVRAVREETWQEQFPEKAAIVETELDDFLRQRPNLITAINDAPNRYKEAWELMNALKPKQQASETKTQPRKDVPNAPGTVPKAAGVNAAMDLMQMSDQEFRDWAKSKRRR